MIYFIPWAVFLASVIMAVPVVAWLEKRKYAAANPAEIQDDASQEGSGSENDEAAVMEAEPDAEPVAEDEVQFDVPGGDDFSAFEDDFK